MVRKFIGPFIGFDGEGDGQGDAKITAICNLKFLPPAKGRLGGDPRKGKL